MKRFNLFKETPEEDTKYSTKIGAPVYLPTGPKPHLQELCDGSKTDRLLKRIEASSLPDNEKEFLAAAACRHTIFNYERIADYYAASGKEMQELMELSGLVIIDFEKAVEHGYIKLSEEIKTSYLEDYEQ